jgi:hypothetical protein
VGPLGLAAPAANPTTAILHFYSALSLTVIRCRSLGIPTVIAALASYGGGPRRGGVEGGVAASEKGVRLTQKVQVGPALISVGRQLSTKGCSWPNFWADTASFLT